MVAALRQRATIQRGGRLVVPDTGLAAGSKVEILVFVGRTTARPASARSRRPGPSARRSRGGLEKFFGVFKSGDPHSSNNERIDRDLAREYASDIEDAD